MERVFFVVTAGRRWEIIGCLAAGPRDVTTIAHELELDLPAISHNLGILKRHGLVWLEVHGLRHIYHLAERVTLVRGAELIEITIRCSNAEVTIRQGVPAARVVNPDLQRACDDTSRVIPKPEVGRQHARHGTAEQLASSDPCREGAVAGRHARGERHENEPTRKANDVRSSRRRT